MTLAEKICKYRIEIKWEGVSTPSGNETNMYVRTKYEGTPYVTGLQYIEEDGIPFSEVTERLEKMVDMIIKLIDRRKEEDGI